MLGCLGALAAAIIYGVTAQCFSNDPRVAIGAGLCMALVAIGVAERLCPSRFTVIAAAISVLYTATLLWCVFMDNAVNGFVFLAAVALCVLREALRACEFPALWERLSAAWRRDPTSRVDTEGGEA